MAIVSFLCFWWIGLSCPSRVATRFIFNFFLIMPVTVREMELYSVKIFETVVLIIQLSSHWLTCPTPVKSFCAFREYWDKLSLWSVINKACWTCALCPYSCLIHYNYLTEIKLSLGSTAVIQLKCTEWLNSSFSDWQQHHRKLDFLRKWAKIVFESQNTAALQSEVHQDFLDGHILVFWTDM